mgnify:CR=1 FL=1
MKEETLVSVFFLKEVLKTNLMFVYLLWLLVVLLSFLFVCCIFFCKMEKPNVRFG